MLKVYSSSAGSGKTYTLTREYLKLALRDRPVVSEDDKPFEPYQFKHILAVTFTNAAANEMKERIRRELLRIAEGHPASMLEALRTEPELRSLDAAELQGRAQFVFHSILHDYSSFSVLTIDSFVQRVVSAFTDELSLPYSFEVEMNSQTVLQTAIDRLLEKVGQDEHPYLTEILEELYVEHAAEGRSWYTLANTLAEFSQKQLNDRNYDFVQRLSELEPNDFRQVRQKLLQKRREAEEAIRQHAAEAIRALESIGLKPTELAQGSRGIGNYFEHRAGEHEYDKEPSPTVINTVKEDAWLGKAAKPAVRQRLDEIKGFLGACFECMEAERSQYILFQSLEQHLQKIALLKQIKQECDDLLREQNQVHISEFNRLILQVVSQEPVPFVYERLGEKYHHILIDEFQDTSRLQFVNLLPLIENNLASGRFNLAVGDAKQAIYRFRGGDMDQIVALHRRQLDDLLLAHADSPMTTERLQGLLPDLRPDRLNTNWRSAASIVAFNNDFFGHLARHYAATEFGKATEVYDEFFAQAVPAHKADTLGHVQIDFLEKPAKDDAEALTGGEAMSQRVLDHIQQVRADGYAYRDIAILCRFKKDARLLADFLEKEGIPLMSEDSLTLASSEQVQLLVALMHFLYQPDNRLVRYQLLFLYHRIVCHQATDEALARQIDERVRTDEAEQLLRYLSPLDREPLELGALTQLSVYELAEKLSLYFDLFNEEGNCAYLFRFFDEILTFSARHGGHLADFLNHWQTAQHTVSVAAPAQSDAVTITTVHKAKGLEYPVVLIPFANWSFKPKTGDTLWMDLSVLEDQPFLTTDRPDGQTLRLRTASVTLGSKLEYTPLSAQYREEVYRTFVECMNLLYVALTRPTDRLYLLAHKKGYVNNKGETTNQTGIDFWLYQYLTQQTGDCRWSDDRLTYILHDCVTRPDQGLRATAAEAESLDIPIRQRAGDRPLRLKRRREAGDFTEQQRRRTQQLCTALTLVNTPACIEKTLRKMITDGQLRAAEADGLKTALEQTLALPELAPYFVSADGNRRQRSVLLPKGLRRGVAHRAVQTPDGIVLLHYQPGPATDVQQAALRALTRLYQEMGYPQVEGRLVAVGARPDQSSIVHVTAGPYNQSEKNKS